MNSDAGLFVVEGRIAGYDLGVQTLTANGIEFHVPPTVLLDVDGDDVGDLSFADVFLSPWESSHSLLGGSVIAEGHFVNLYGTCFDRIADLVHVEFAEHVLIGPLTHVDPQMNTIEICGSPVTLNVDPRFPARVLGLVGQSIALDDLAGFKGTLVSAEGYQEAGVLRALLVESDAWVPSATSDTVLIERAHWDHSKNAIDVRGFVSRDPQGHRPVGSVQVYLGAWSGTACGGTFEASVSTTFDPLLNLATFRYRSPDQSFVSAPAGVCVSSPAGGGHSARVVVH